MSLLSSSSRRCLFLAPPVWEADISRLHPTRLCCLPFQGSNHAPFSKHLALWLLASLLPKPCHHPGPSAACGNHACSLGLFFILQTPQDQGPLLLLQLSLPLPRVLGLGGSPWSLHLQNLDFPALLKSSFSALPSSLFLFVFFLCSHHLWIDCIFCFCICLMRLPTL